MENRIRQKASPSRFLKTVKNSPMKSSFNSMAAVTIPLPASLSASFHPESGQLQNSVPAAAPRSRKKDSQNPELSFLFPKFPMASPIQYRLLLFPLYDGHVRSIPFLSVHRIPSRWAYAMMAATVFPSVSFPP